MIYSRLYFKNKPKIPVPAAIIVILFVLLIFLRIFSGTNQPSKAYNNKLKRVEITNISSNSVTIFWQSQEKEIGWVIYGETPKKLNKIALDDRDLPSKKNPYYNHYVTIRNLEEKKEYFFLIVSGNKITGKQINIPFNFSTILNNDVSKNLKPAYGRVVELNNQPLSGGIVILKVNEKVISSSLTKSTGEWLIPMDLSKISSSSKILLEIFNEEGKNSTIITNPDKISPLPETIVIGKNYDFNQDKNILSVSSTRKDNKIDIIYPKQNAIIPGRIPLIKGTALPETKVLILIKSSKIYSAKVKADKKGLWSFLPPEPLSLGENVISINTKGENGKEFVIQRKFTIIGKEGSDAAVLGEATPSSTITLTPTVLSPTLNPSPTLQVSPTLMSTFTPIPSSSLPVSGNDSFFSILFGASFIIFGLGALLVF